jgi:hypothetical protein
MFGYRLSVITNKYTYYLLIFPSDLSRHPNYQTHLKQVSEQFVPQAAALLLGFLFNTSLKWDLASQSFSMIKLYAFLKMALSFGMVQYIGNIEVFRCVLKDLFKHSFKSETSSLTYLYSITLIRLFLNHA